MPIRLFAVILRALTIGPSLSMASSFGPADGFAGNPPANNNCTLCHFGDVNTGGGALTLLGLPSEYTPNQTYSLTLTLSDSTQARWGFEITALDANNDFAQGGQLIVTDNVMTQISEDSGGTLDYLKHRVDGTQEGASSGSWTFDWTAPDSSLAGVAFYVGGNAANVDVAVVGDNIYTQVYNLEPEGSTPVQQSTWGSIKAFYGND